MAERQATDSEAPPETSPSREGHARPARPMRLVRGVGSIRQDLSTAAAGRIVLALLSVASVLMTTRLLGPAGYGLLALVTIVADLVFAVSGTWTTMAVRRYGREDLELRGTMNRVTWSRLIVALPPAAFAVVVVLALEAAGAMPSGVSWLLVSTALGYGLALFAVDHCVCLLETSGRMKASAVGQVLAQAGFIGALLVVLMTGAHATPLSILSLSLASSLALTVALAPLLWKTALAPAVIERDMVRRVLRLSLPMIGFTLSQYAFGAVDLVMLRIFRSASDVGVYGVAYQAFNVIAFTASAVTAVLIPLLVSLDIRGRQDVIVRYVRSGVGAAVLAIATLAGVVLPVIPLLVPLVLGQRFAGAGTPLVILGIGAAALGATYTVSPLMTLHERTRVIASINIVAALLNVLADLIMLAVFHMGIIAPAIATAMALVFMFAAFYRYACRTLAVKGRLELWWAAPLAAGLLPLLLLGTPWGTAVGVPAAAVTAMAVLVWRPPFGSEDVELIPDLPLPERVRRALMWSIELRARGAGSD